MEAHTPAQSLKAKGMVVDNTTAQLTNQPIGDVGARVSRKVRAF
jgi:hypothetical protein